jgi:large subunit ribosomal protein L7Ae
MTNENEVPKEIVEKALNSVKLAKQSGAIKKGVNEVTKSLERGLSVLVVVANDVEPREVVMHIAPLCEQKRVPLVFVPTKLEVGKAAGLNVPCSSVAVEKAGSGDNTLKEVSSWAMAKPAAKEAK